VFLKAMAINIFKEFSESLKLTSKVFSPFQESLSSLDFLAVIAQQAPNTFRHPLVVVDSDLKGRKAMKHCLYVKRS
jgi:hypothetical protein